MPMVSFALCIVISYNPLAVSYEDEGVFKAMRLIAAFLNSPHFDFYDVSVFIKPFKHVIRLCLHIGYYKPSIKRLQ
jgi:hypothetical protein